MVMFLNPPSAWGLSLVDDIVVERQGGGNFGFFSGIRVEWRRRVEHYVKSGGCPTSVPQWPDIEWKKNSFINLYSSPADGSAQGKMLKSLREHDLVLCPSCGEAGSPNTLDHYLPKQKYPHFCVTPHNLFPMCDSCQGKKSDKTLNKAKKRIFLHPYFDRFASNQILYLIINPPFDAPGFQIEVDQGLKPEEIGLVERHLQEMQIEERYGRFFKEQHRRMIKLVAKMRNSTQDVIENIELFRDMAEGGSRNSWEFIYYDSVLGNKSLSKYFLEGDLPLKP